MFSYKASVNISVLVDEVHILTPEPVTILCNMERGIKATDVIKTAHQLNLRWVIILDYTSRPNDITGILLSERGECVSEGCGKRKTQPAIADFEDGRRSWTKEFQQHLEAGKGKTMDPLQALPEGKRPCPHLDLSPTCLLFWFLTSRTIW